MAVSLLLGVFGLSCVVVGLWLWGGSVAIDGWPTLQYSLLVTGLVTLLLALPVPYRLIKKHNALAAGAHAAGRRQPRPWHSMRLRDVLAECHASPQPTKAGLSAQAAEERLEQQGPNSLDIITPISFWDTLMKELHEPTLVLLQVVAVLYALIGDLNEAMLALGINAAMILAEVATEHR